MHCINGEVVITYSFSVVGEKDRECCLPLLMYRLSTTHSSVNEGAVDMANWGTDFKSVPLKC